MPDIITDFSDIAKRANLGALKGRPQDSVTAGIAPTVAPEPEQGWHVYWQENLYGLAGHGPCTKHGMDDCSVCHR